MAEIDNDKLLQDFFSENKQEIADNEFSRRVMHHLPDRNKRLVHIWTSCMMILGIVLFVSLGGLEATWRTLQDVFTNMISHEVVTLDPKSLIITAIVLLFMGMKKVCSLA
ncbi:DUF5056 domain-containing protein [Bacteroides sp.]|uniref:DUF5056 domain-containing protein n=1 Tax=Bacteroides sp. TaxID=29523 RepID=UPI002602DE55|nr:DUF5056 domain-containing protein [Bacteroides sp.]MDD3038419.1 DUF5056 domain-containing protein [Bacteroides sp.]